MDGRRKRCKVSVCSSGVPQPRWSHPSSLPKALLERYSHPWLKASLHLHHYSCLGDRLYNPNHEELPRGVRILLSSFVSLRMTASGFVDSRRFSKQATLLLMPFILNISVRQLLPLVGTVGCRCDGEFMHEEVEDDLEWREERFGCWERVASGETTSWRLRVQWVPMGLLWARGAESQKDSSPCIWFRMLKLLRTGSMYEWYNGRVPWVTASAEPVSTLMFV